MDHTEDTHTEDLDTETQMDATSGRESPVIAQELKVKLILNCCMI